MASPVYFQLDDSEFRSALRRYALARRIDFAKAIQQQARLIAVNLAFQTQPFGENKGRAQGEGAVKADLTPPRGIFKPLNQFWMSEAVRMKQYAPENFVRRFTNKKGEVWLTEEDQVLTTQGAIKQFHQSMRTQGGRRRTSQAGNFDRTIGRTKAGNRGAVDRDNLQKYVQTVQKKVGMAKAGWADCAKQIGGMRGIPQWVTRHAGKRSKGIVTDNTKASGPEQYVMMENTVPWIDKCLTQSQMQRALDIQRGKMETAIEKTLAAAQTL